MRKLFTSEAVTEGHPDKICDRISDAVLDAILAKDPAGRVACECFATTGLVVVGGEITTDCYVDIQKVAREAICETGYNNPAAGFDGNTCAIMTCLDGQSPDIDMGVTGALEVKEGRGKDTNSLLGAGDQGMMFGYATRPTTSCLCLSPWQTSWPTSSPSTAKAWAIPLSTPMGKRRSQWNMGTMGSPSA